MCKLSESKFNEFTLSEERQKNYDLVLCLFNALHS